MADRLRVVSKLPSLRSMVAKYRAAGETVALVPTMGALHAGHLSLVRLARRRADRVIVSIFVNPTQFAPSEDFTAYPRTFKSDVAALRAADTDMVWAPAVELMYPHGFATRIVPEGPAAVGLEDAVRPHFFGGVATVVNKLLLQVLPDVAIFGEKDFQQLRVIEQMVRDLDMPVKIVAGKTVREPDGLAMSSRNAYLSGEQRAHAALLYRVLQDAARMIAQGGDMPTVLRQGRTAIRRAGFTLDYLEARDAETLQPVKAAEDGPLRLLVAAKLGATRLIDNVAVPRAR